MPSRWRHISIGRVLDLIRRAAPVIIRNTRVGRSVQTATVRNPTPFCQCNMRVVQWFGIRVAVLALMCTGVFIDEPLLNLDGYIIELS